MSDDTPEVRAARMRRLEAQLARLDAETQKLRAEADAAALHADDARIDSQRKREAREEELAGNKYHHVYLFTDQVSASSSRACMAQLSTWHRLDPQCPMEIVFSSPGGSVIDGMALFDFIQELRREGHTITTGARGMAASMAGILLQAGDVRWIGSEAYLLIHEVQAGAVGKVGEMEDEMELIHKMCDRILGIFAARCHLTAKQLSIRWRRKDWWLDSTESLKLGFVDEVR